MLSKWGWILLQLSRQLWMRTVFFAGLAVATSLAAIALKGVIPESISGAIGADAVDKILTILASSMLTVTTFSLSVMVAAYSAATNNITPRATRLLMQDATTQNALATFIGSFVYSLVGLIALSTGVYGEAGRVVLFVVTIAVIIIIVGTILLWVNHLSQLGRVSETTDRVEQAAHAAIRQRMKHPWLDGHKLAGPDAVPNNAQAIYPTQIGYVQHIDVQAINRWAEEHKTQMYIVSLPGAFVHPGRALAYCSAALDEIPESLLKAFYVADERSFDQDPRFGLVVMAEIASRALSPAVNDPGTAIDVIGRGVRVLSDWEVTDEDGMDIPCPYVWVLPIELNDIFEDFFTTIARDGAAYIEVQIRLQKALAALAQKNAVFYEVAQRHSKAALARARISFQHEEDIARINSTAESLFGKSAAVTEST